ncbi:DivIVA domain-containing protein [Streptomyces erythrochromogenes]|uniref:DivIVA domain-containing protein n=1 Tax=Streptomyces erythrochromogenes TaxID=285574 RepID=UPI0036BCC97C
MTDSSAEVSPQDATAIAQYDEAFRDFTIELNRLHIAFGAPSYATLVKASVSPKLTKAGLNELLSGKRLPSLETLLEFVRVASRPTPPLPHSPAVHRADTALTELWRTRWQHVKLLHRQAQNPWKHVRATAQETLEQALREAEALRTAAHAEADRIRAEAKAEVEALMKQAEDISEERTRIEAFMSSPPEAVLHGMILLVHWRKERGIDAQDFDTAAEMRNLEKRLYQVGGQLNKNPLDLLEDVLQEVRRVKIHWVDEQEFERAYDWREAEKLVLQCRAAVNKLILVSRSAFSEPFPTCAPLSLIPGPSAAGS